MTEEEKRDHAWIGDAVLALYARQWILQQPGIEPKDRADVFTDMTSNRFLSALGEPTAMEAAIGLAYADGGLQAAFAHIESTLLPVFKKQAANRRHPGNYKRK